jgi:uncharacterized repeat protein (TIGR01451 family)
MERAVKTVQIRFVGFAGLFLFACLMAAPVGAAVQVAVESSASRAAPGGYLFVEIRVANNGATTATDLNLEMPYPADVIRLAEGAVIGLDGCIGDGDGLCEAGEIATWNIGDLAAGTAVTYFLTPRVSSSAVDGAIIDWTATVSSGSSTVASYTQTVTVDEDTALNLAVEQPRDSVVPGQQIRYTVLFGNAAASNALGTTISLPVPAGTSFVSATDSGTLNNGAVQWSIGTLLGQTTGQVTAVVEVNNGLADATLVHVEDAVIDASIDGQSQTQATSAMALTRGSPRGLRLSLDAVFEGASPLAARPVDIEVTLTNDSLQAIDDIDLHLNVPAGSPGITSFKATELTGCLPSTSVVCGDGDILLWTVASLAPGEARTFYLTPDADRPGRSDDFRAADLMGWHAVAATADGDLASDSQILPATAESTLTLTVDEDRNPVRPGEELVYTINYGNMAESNALSTRVTFPLPPGTTFVSASAGGVQAGDDVVWELGPLFTKRTGELEVTVLVDAGLPPGTPIIVDTAEIRGTFGGILRRQSAGSTAYVTDGQPLQLALALAHSLSGTSAPTLDAAITVSNTSEAPVTGTRLYFQIPSGVLSVAGPLTWDATSCQQGNVISSCNEGIFWDIGTLAAGESRIYQIPQAILVLTTAAQLLDAEAAVSADNGVWVTETETARIETAPPLQLAIDADLNPAVAGSDVTYLLTYANVNPTDAATDAGLVLPLPPGATLVSASDGGSFDAGAVHWSLDTLPAATTGTVSAVVRLDSSVPDGTLVEIDKARLTGVFAGIPTTQEARHVLYVGDVPQLSLAVQVNPNPDVLNGLVEIEYVITNTSPSTVSGAELLAKIPYGMRGLSPELATAGAQCNLSCGPGGTVSWTLPLLGPGEARRFTLVGLTDNSEAINGELLPWVARLSGDAIAQQVESKTLRLEAAPPLTLSVDADASPVGNGQRIQYTISYGNAGAETATGTTLRFPVPGGTQFVAASNGGVLVDGNVLWNLGELTAGDIGRLFVQVDTPASADKGTLIEVDTARITGTLSGVVRESRAGHVAFTDNIPQALSLQQTVTPNPVAPNSPVDATLVLSNTSASFLTGVKIRLRYPFDLLPLNTTDIPEITTCEGQILPTRCDPGETAFWDIGLLAPGETRTIPFAPTVSGLLPDGSLVRWRALASSDNGDYVTEHDTTLVSSVEFDDTDGDGVVDLFDNCPGTPNPDQVDFLLDGLGDACDPDHDDDGIPNTVEDTYAFLDPRDPTDADRDQDNDGLSNLEEYLAGTGLDDSDTDDDGLPDGYEAQYAFLDPKVSTDAALDFDNDGSINLDEFRAGTDPSDPASIPGAGTDQAAVINIIIQLLLEE